MVPLLWYQKVAFVKFPIIMKFVIRAFLYLNSSSLHMVFSRYWAHKKSYRESKIGASNRSFLWPFIKHQEKISYKPRIFWALSYAFKTVYRTISETLWDKLQNLLAMKLTTDVTLLLLSAVDNDIFIFFHLTGVDSETNWINEDFLC